MCDPSFYDHPVDRVELIQTHISSVFLTGDVVYKLKKPVDFGFLDFSTREKRVSRRMSTCGWRPSGSRTGSRRSIMKASPLTGWWSCASSTAAAWDPWSTSGAS